MWREDGGGLKMWNFIWSQDTVQILRPIPTLKNPSTWWQMNVQVESATDTLVTIAKNALCSTLLGLASSQIFESCTKGGKWNCSLANGLAQHQQITHWGSGRQGRLKLWLWLWLNIHDLRVDFRDTWRYSYPIPSPITTCRISARTSIWMKMPSLYYNEDLI